MQYSENWSGYVATTSASKPFSVVTGKWTEPAVTCAGLPDELVAFWVGLDGWYGPENGTVEQLGTEAGCDGTTPIYGAWWETHPTGGGGFNFQVYPGDIMQATVAYAKGVFKLTLADLTKGHKASQTVDTACPPEVTCYRLSAEWIAESPFYRNGQGGGQYANLPEWSYLNFYPDQASVKTNGKLSFVGSFTDFPVTMTGADGYRAAPSPLGPRGEGFTVTWLSEAP
jgi:hypothetical protein